MPQCKNLFIQLFWMKGIVKYIIDVARFKRAQPNRIPQRLLMRKTSEHTAQLEIKTHIGCRHWNGFREAPQQQVNIRGNEPFVYARRRERPERVIAREKFIAAIT